MTNPIPVLCEVGPPLQGLAVEGEEGGQKARQHDVRHRVLAEKETLVLLGAGGAEEGLRAVQQGLSPRLVLRDLPRPSHEVLEVRLLLPLLGLVLLPELGLLLRQPPELRKELCVHVLHHLQHRGLGPPKAVAVEGRQLNRVGLVHEGPGLPLFCGVHEAAAGGALPLEVGQRLSAVRERGLHATLTREGDRGHRHLRIDPREPRLDLLALHAFDFSLVVLQALLREKEPHRRGVGRHCHAVHDHLPDTRTLHRHAACWLSLCPSLCKGAHSL
mmetsp:Transcript_2763/g.8374  ORF Transcript_2763/g.8374 Transcript_2763/m.8374 type:complete len:273 (-) Transcript_2763:269-1087(-)